MSTYHLNKPDSEQTKKTLLKIVPLILLASIPALLMVYASSKEFPILMVVFPLMLIVVITIGITLGIKRQSSSLFIIDNNQITFRRSGRPDVMVKREDVKHILESDDGSITIKSIDPNSVIYVPKELLNYDQLKMEISSWKLIEKNEDNKKPMMLTYLMLGLQVVFAIGAFLFKEIVFLYLIGVSLVAFIVYRLFLDMKSFLVTKDKKKLVSLIIPILLVGYILFNIMASIFK
jgi:hypothetical protein